MPIQRIVIANAKGGCGKTTLATNIASYYASRGKHVRLFDHDHQNSALHWSRRRQEPLLPIDVVNASRGPDNRMTRSWQLRVPAGTDLVVVDTPAGVGPSELAALVVERDYLIIPVLPSPIDIHATAHFIKDLLLVGRARQRQLKVSVVANRVRKNTRMYHALERFLFSLDIPFVTALRDTQNYPRAIDQGLSVLELKQRQRKLEQEQWAPLLRWLQDAPFEAQIHPFPQSNKRLDRA